MSLILVSEQTHQTQQEIIFMPLIIHQKQEYGSISSSSNYVRKESVLDIHFLLSDSEMW
jgi:hypothetical protein